MLSCHFSTYQKTNFNLGGALTKSGDMLVTTLVFAFLFYNPGIFRPTLIIEDETVVVKKRSGEVSIPFSNLKNVEVKQTIWGRMMKFYYEGGKVVTYPKDVDAAVSYLRQLGVTCIKES